MGERRGLIAAACLAAIAIMITGCSTDTAVREETIDETATTASEAPADAEADVLETTSGPDVTGLDLCTAVLLAGSEGVDFGNGIGVGTGQPATVERYEGIQSVQCEATTSSTTSMTGQTVAAEVRLISGGPAIPERSSAYEITDLDGRVAAVIIDEVSNRAVTSVQLEPGLILDVSGHDDVGGTMANVHDYGVMPLVRNLIAQWDGEGFYPLTDGSYEDSTAFCDSLGFSTMDTAALLPDAPRAVSFSRGATDYTYGTEVKRDGNVECGFTSYDDVDTLAPWRSPFGDSGSVVGFSFDGFPSAADAETRTQATTSGTCSGAVAVGTDPSACGVESARRTNVGNWAVLAHYFGQGHDVSPEQATAIVTAMDATIADLTPALVSTVLAPPVYGD